MSNSNLKEFICISTNNDGWFKVTIKNPKGETLFSEIMQSLNKKITLRGFSLEQVSIIISPVD